MVPIGGIINWSGSVVSIPSNYQLCNGTNGTPDLRDKFVVGAGTTYAVDAVGGAVDHQHLYDEDVHTHDAGAFHDCPGSGTIDSATVFGTGQIAAAGSSQKLTLAGPSLPPYLALAYIQRMT